MSNRRNWSLEETTVASSVQVFKRFIKEMVPQVRMFFFCNI